MHYTELYIFALDLCSNSLNHFIWKRLEVTVCGRLPLSRYANTWLDHDDVSIGLYCVLLAAQWKSYLRSTSVQVMNTWHLEYGITRLQSQYRNFAPILIITGPKNDHFLYANKLGLSIRGSEILQKWLWLEWLIVTRVESFCHKRDSSRFESPSFSTWLDSTRVESKSPKIVTRVEPLTRVTLSLNSYISKF